MPEANGKTYHFEIPQDMVVVLSEALGNMPFRIAMPVINELQRQISAQEQRKEE